MMKFAWLGCVAMLCAGLAGCGNPEQVPMNFPKPQVKDYEAQLAPGELALRRITDPAEIPDFAPACANLAGLRDAIALSLNYLSKPSSQRAFPYGEISHDQAVASLQAFEALLDANLTPQQMNDAIRKQFDVYTSVGCDRLGTVLFTCYYTPIFDASPVRTERFRYPLYKAPADLVKGPDGTPTTPLPDRRTIETSALYAGNELAWMADPFEAYVAHIQGSCRLRWPDGQEMTVGYTANNGHDYNSVRAELVKDNKIGKRDGLPAMLRYFHNYPNEVTAYTWRNPRFIFFAVIDDGRPRGCLNEPVTPRRSIATDKRIFPAGCLAMLSTALPARQGSAIVDAPYEGFACDQDSGGAIRAPGRCDLYLGIGAEAGELAGRAQNEGRLYYVFLKPSSALPPSLRSSVLPPATPAPATTKTPKAPAKTAPAKSAPPATVETPATSTGQPLAPIAKPTREDVP
jgi:membrane-bound lytic murein transglycosylase A